MTSGLDSREHIYRHRPVVPVEQQLIDEHVRDGARALDIGTAATGRSAIMLRDAGAEVHSIEINAAALAEFAASDDCRDLHLAVADMVELPFADRSFDVVLIGLHGSDYLIGAAERSAAFAEVGRVLRPGGVLVFNAFNNAGLALSPSGLRAAAFLKVRARYLVTARFARRTMVDINGLRLHQSLPGRLIREVEHSARLHFAAMSNQSGSSRNRWLVGLLASAPYYVFLKDHSS